MEYNIQETVQDSGNGRLFPADLYMEYVLYVARFTSPASRALLGEPSMAFETYVISWNITKRCGLRCEHCYLDASYLAGRETDELTLRECRVLIDQMAEINPQACLILTGGEPLLRPDIFEIASYAHNRGFMVVVGSGGNLINESLAHRLVESGV